MYKRVELGDGSFDRVGSLVFARGQRASLEIAMLKHDPVRHQVAVEKRVGPNETLAVQK
jgi:hypothetical protein